MNLTPEELTEVRRHNQRVKALGTGRVTITWENGKIKKTEIDASFVPTIYDLVGDLETHCRETGKGLSDRIDEETEIELRRIGKPPAP